MMVMQFALRCTCIGTAGQTFDGFACAKRLALTIEHKSHTRRWMGFCWCAKERNRLAFEAYARYPTETRVRHDNQMMMMIL